MTNTFDAHRLAKYASQQGKEGIFQDFFRAYFTDGRHLGEHETLIELAVQAGLNEDEIRHILAGNDYAAEVHADEEEAQRLGATGVPFFVIDRKYAISGAQSSDVLLQALKTAWKDYQPLQILNGAMDSESTDICGDGACTIK
ncbi:DsbA family oxidoreductase [Paenibacillus kribbensis]|uniref:DsbA family oxidoreductase n=1 Tax=Paenibacillus kribbensis TaxID=172713 RepID=UPI000A951D8D|nr:DsbA family oxidoreductase [Paenibacillus kribbensis]